MLLASHTTLQGDLERGAVLVAITTSLLLLRRLWKTQPVCAKMGL